jgi:hypothetical protein
VSVALKRPSHIQYERFPTVGPRSILDIAKWFCIRRIMTPRLRPSV